MTATCLGVLLTMLSWSTTGMGREKANQKGVQEFRSSGVQEFRSSGVQEFRSSGVQGAAEHPIASKKELQTVE
jgi:hypothetical protein